MNADGEQPLRVLLVDDDVLMRSLLRESLESQGFAVRSCGSVEEAAGWARSNSIDVACLDVDLRSTLSGFDLARILQRLPNPPAIMFLTAVGDPAFFDPDANPVIEGASYLPKSNVRSGAVLANAIRSAHAGLTFVDPDLVTGGGKGGGPEALSRQQLHILRLCSQGLTNSAIARELGVSVTTIETALSRVAKKLGVTSSPNTNMRVACINAYLENVGRA